MTETTAIRRVAVVLFDGFTVLDAYGPIQAFAACRRLHPDGTHLRFFEIFTLGEQPGPVRSGEGPATQADHSFSDAEPAAAAHGGTEINLDGHLLGSGTSVSPQPLPTESVSFNFEQMKPTYGPADLGSATGASAPSGDAPGGWTPIVGDWNGDGEDAPTASREETITVHGNRTEDADSSHVVEDIALTYQKIELEHVGEASDPASLAAPAGEGAEAIRVDPAHLMVTGSSLSSGGGEPQAEAPETPGSHEVASASSGAGADGDVDGRDFLIWRRSPGGGAATDAGAALAAPEAVAEPGTAADGGTSTAAPAGPATETLEIVHAGSPDESPPEDAEAAATEEPG
ncbi:MAG: hypothetical protein L0221_00715 [Chloroflexi bacterium]|nr:hypothetical protein [Chloroflexota bacterium]